jgi:antitoxin (DNA-binding transcriptional repressor) of toxin-antitoxin stability system
MKTITIRDLRQRWPRAEALLAHETEILITRDGTPIAKLVRLQKAPSRRKRFDPRQHARWQDQVNRGRVVRLVDEFLTPDRDAR